MVERMEMSLWGSYLRRGKGPLGDLLQRPPAPLFRN